MMCFLLLDFFFYTYTSWSTCFFLLSFLYGKKSIFVLALWDFFVLHTNGYFFVLCLLLSFLRGFLKYSSQTRVKCFLFLTFFFALFLYFTNQDWMIYGFGFFLNFLLVLFGDKMFRCFINIDR